MKRYHLLSTWAALLLLLTITSCSKMPDYAKFIPEDAPIVFRVDVAQLADKSGAGDNSKMKQAITDAMKKGDLSSETQRKIKKIIDSPKEAGLDLRKPLLIFANPEERDNLAVGIIGKVYDDDDFESLLNTFAKEADTEQVKTGHKVKNIFFDETAIFFDKDYFLITQKRYSTEPEQLTAQVEELFHSEGKHSMKENENLKKICSMDGVMQLLVSGDAVMSTLSRREKRHLEELMPKGLDLGDVSYAADLSIKKGEATLTYQVLTESDDWQEFLEKGEDIVDKVKGKYANYTEDDGLVVMANVNGKKYSKLIEEMGLYKHLGEMEQEVRNLVESIDGEAVFSLPEYNSNINFPVFSAYVTTKDKSLLNTLSKHLEGEAEETGKNQYTMTVAYDYSSSYYSDPKPSCFLTFGQQDDAVYFVSGKQPQAFTKARNKFSTSNIKGKGIYAYFRFDFLNQVLKEMDGREAAYAQQAVNLCDYTEIYYAGDGKAVWSLTMKDKDKTPLEAVVDIAMRIYEDNVAD